MTVRHASWFKFYPSDFMGGVRGLSAQEVGLYTMLLARIYEENGPIEFNALRLSTYCGMREATFTKTLEKLIALGKIRLCDGMLSNARAEIEISNRSRDLEIASRAGKASAEKRQQNQRKAATGDYRPFNHTDTDKKDDDDCAGEDGFRGKILEAIGCGVGDQSGLCGPADMAEARRWLDLPHVTDDLACDQIRQVMARKGSTEPPHRIAYFTEEMRRLSASIEAAKTPLAPASKPHHSKAGAVSMAVRAANVDLDELAALWAPKLLEGGFVPPSAISCALARHMLEGRLVTQSNLRRAGVSF